MVIINFKSSKKEAFRNGLLKGMAAPYMIYGSFTAPALPKIVTIKSMAIPPDAAIAQDWHKIKNDFHVAIINYGKTTKKQNAV
jgi:hypothetical protein